MKPLILVGHGVRIARAEDDLMQLIELLGIPTITSRLGKDLIPYNHKLNFGQPGLVGEIFSPEILKSTDLLIVLGSRMPVQMIGDNYENFNEDIKVIMIDIDQNEIENHQSIITESLNIDVGFFIREMLLNKKLYYKNKKLDIWYNYCLELKNNNPISSIFKKDNPIDLYYFMSRIDF